MLTRRRTRKYNRALDREERALRKAASHGHCYFCSISGRTVKATHGQLCERHFDEVNFPKAFNPDL